MQGYTLVLFGVVCGLIGAAICTYVYRLGVRRGRSTVVPFPLYDELLDHRIDCLGQDPVKARIEVESSLGAAGWES